MKKKMTYKYVYKRINKNKYDAIISSVKPGDIVHVTNGGCQYSSYSSACKYFGIRVDDLYHIPYKGNGDYQDIVGEKRRLWKVEKIAIHGNYSRVVLFLKDKTGLKCIVDTDGVEVIRSPKINPPTEVVCLDSF